METHKLITLVSRRYSIEQCRINFDCLFIYGDNLERIGTAGQACIREQINAVGLCTKKKPGGNSEDYFTDKEFDENCILIDEEIEKIKKYMEEKEYKAIGFPWMGLGTGLSAMQTKCPKTFCYLTMRLIDEFNFNNIEALRSN